MVDDVRTPLDIRVQRGPRARDLDRRISAYVEQGYPQLQARARALSDIAREDMAAKYSIEPIREEMITNQLKDQKEKFYLRHPRLLAENQTIDPATLPGYDPTRIAEGTSRYGFDPITREITLPSGEPLIRFSRPMTQEDVSIARMTQPIPIGHVGPAGGYNPPGLLERAMSIVRTSEPSQTTAPTATGPEINSIGNAPTAAPTAAAPTTATAPVMTPTASQGEIGQPPVGFDRYLPEPDLFVPPSSSPAAPVARAVQVARQAVGVPLPPQRPDRFAPQPPSHEAAMDARKNAVQNAWRDYEQSGTAADFVRASALMQANMPERQQEADGGAIKAKGAAKPDAIHKALEIIHHLLMRER